MQALTVQRACGLLMVVFLARDKAGFGMRIAPVKSGKNRRSGCCRE